MMVAKSTSLPRQLCARHITANRFVAVVYSESDSVRIGMSKTWVEEEDYKIFQKIIRPDRTESSRYGSDGAVKPRA